MREKGGFQRLLHDSFYEKDRKFVEAVDKTNQNLTTQKQKLEMDLQSEVVLATKRSLQNEINEIPTKVQANTELELVNIVKKQGVTVLLNDTFAIMENDHKRLKYIKKEKFSVLPQKSMNELSTLYDNGQYKDLAEKFVANVKSLDYFMEELEKNKLNKNNQNNNNSTNGSDDDNTKEDDDTNKDEEDTVYDTKLDDIVEDNNKKKKTIKKNKKKVRF